MNANTETKDKPETTLLIVDDDASARDTLEALLSAEDYRLVFATNGEEAIARLADNIAPDAILLDVMMPGMDGFEVCRCIKRKKRWQRIPIVLVTALDQTEHVVQGLEAGADEFLSKPVNGAELRARVRTVVRLKKQFDELEAAMELREKMASMVVHDMRGPLMVIAIQCGLLRLGQTMTPEDERGVRSIQTQAERLNAFTNDMLVMSKLSCGKMNLNRSPVDLAALCREAVDSQRMIANTRKINLVLDLPAQGIPPLSLDAKLFQRVLENLLANSIKYSPAGGKVSLRGEFPGSTAGATGAERCRILVTDEGRGIPEEHRHRLFEQFATIELKEKDVAQTGLGLHFCKLVVEAHGGRIHMEPNRPQGSIFVIEL